MSEPTLEARVAALEKLVGELQQKLNAGHPAEKSGILAVAGSMKDFPEFDDVVAFGRYYRKTGKLPPDDWKPGDPIPESVE